MFVFQLYLFIYFPLVLIRQYFFPINLCYKNAENFEVENMRIEYCLKTHKHGEGNTSMGIKVMALLCVFVNWIYFCRDRGEDELF